MSTKYPDWWELPKERWQETSTIEEKRWNPEWGGFAYTGKLVKERTWRDSQRQKLYDAESAARWKWKNLHGKDSILRFDSIEEISTYVEKLLKSRWITKRFGKQRIPKIVFSPRGGSAFSDRRDQQLVFPRWAMNELIVLHELAHWIHPTGYGVAHGRFFARTFLELCEWKMGREFRMLLKEQYKKYKVMSSPFPNYSEETLQKKRMIGAQLAEVFGR